MGTSATDARTRPWYRERWPWLLAAGPAIVVVAAIATAWLAAATDDGLVADDYYKRGLAINRVLERESRAEAMQIGAIVRVGGDGAVRVDLSSATAEAPLAQLRLRLAHPTRAGQDVVVALERAADGSYAGRAGATPEGRRVATLESDGWRLPSVEIVAPGEARLGAARLAR
jgi:hypothetical protein